MIPCPEPGALRATLDGERPDLAAHVEQCASCQARSAAQSDDAAFASARLGAGPSLDARAIAAAMHTVRARNETAPVAAVTPRRLGAGPLRAAAGLATVVLAAALLTTPGGRAAAASWLERFRAERVTAVPVDIAAVDPAALEALVDHAEVEGLDDILEPQRVANLDAAAVVAGFAVTALDPDSLPNGVTGPVEILAQAPQQVRITFADDAEVPQNLRGATLRLFMPGAVVQRAGGEGSRAVVVRGEAGALEVVVESGQSLSEIRDAVLSLPGLPEDTVATLRAIEDWETTLPLPVPAGHIAWSETTIAGRPALAFGDESGLGSAVLWHDGRRFVGVGGTLPLSVVRDLAEDGG